jgi:hypothetical protein
VGIVSASAIQNRRAMSFSISFAIAGSDIIAA